MVSIILSPLSTEAFISVIPTHLSLISWLIYNRLDGSLDGVMAERVKDKKKIKTSAVKREREGADGRLTQEETRLRYL